MESASTGKALITAQGRAGRKHESNRGVILPPPFPHDKWGMSVSQILDELTRLSPPERLHVAERALALDTLSAEDSALVEKRLGEHLEHPETAIPLDGFLAQIRERYAV